MPENPSSFPPITQAWQAIERYLALAYESAPPPAAVVKRLEQLRQAGENFWQSPAFESDPKLTPLRINLRLGNRHYPHMKLVIEARPDGQGFIYRADTH